jgi:bifunctional non-homologous end joining protein LigD
VAPGLQTYREKRRFDVTSEPRGKKARAKGHTFVIQKHAATRLHYDLRLELDGVMKSWAVTRGPSLVPGEKRLAIHVEDHPIEYNTFEGTIPKGQYGGGTVMIWDRGEWFPEGDPHAAYKKGHLDFSLEGEKLHGRWHLVRMRKRSGERQDPWLLIKSEDDAARGAKDPDVLEEQSLSVATGRSMDEITSGRPVRKKSARKTTPAAAVWHSNRGSPAEARAAKAVTPRPRERKARTATKKSGAAKKKAKASRKGPPVEGARPALLPAFVPPALTVLSSKAPDAPNWLHEIKFDGYRIQARLDGGKITLYTRRGLDWTEKFQSVADALVEVPADKALIDGEIVVEANGFSNFSALQEELKGGGQNFIYYAFDLLHLDGYDLTRAPLIARKQALKDLFADFPAAGAIRFSDHFEEKGSVILAHACKMNLEGIISKARDAPYRSGRSGDWAKTKCSDRQEFVVVGYAPATNDPRAVGALIVGYYEDGELKYAGRVGTGYTNKVARELWQKLDPLRTENPPFKPLPAEERGRKGIWVAPKMVIEIDFRGWTHGMRLRHPSFKGVREDKLATEVVREDKKMVAKASASAGETKASTTKAKTAKPVATKRAPASGKSSKSSKSSKASPGDVHLTNPDRVYWEDVGLTKAGLADYYTQVWDWIAPHVVGRALSLVRCPEGTSGQCFFQKHASAGLDSKKLQLVPEDGDHVISIDDLDGLLALVQAGVLEIHVRGSTINHLTEANRIVFDLDPSPECKFPEVVKAAREVRDRLEELNLKSFLKTTGGKGLHVVVPIAHTPWDEVKTFTKLVAQSMEAEKPSRYIATASIKARKGKIFVDYLRNSREATAICAYSTRAREGATVSVPLAWEELGSLKEANRYTVANVMKRLKTIKRDPWADISKVKQKLPRLRRGK